jgi:hypothetical protein
MHKKKTNTNTNTILKDKAENKAPSNNVKQYSVQEEIQMLQSLLNQMTYINLMLDQSFTKQTELAESQIYEKVNYLIKLREENFNIFSQISSMTNISKIEEYFDINYTKILSSEPKLSNTLENINDVISNISYGVDRFYLEDNLACDENELKNVVNITTGNLDKLITQNEDKVLQIKELKENYIIFYQLIVEYKLKIDKIKILMDSYRTDVIDKNLENIKTVLKFENEALKDNLFGIE